MMLIKLTLAIIILITCIVSDNLMETVHHPIFRAVIDNAAHAIIGAFSGIVFATLLNDKISMTDGWLLILTSFIISSFIDLDHFIAARSFHIEDATSLTNRPFLHCSTIPILLYIFYFLFNIIYYDLYKFSLYIAIILVAFITHHCRDAIRRGFWLYPFSHTERISYTSYILLTIITPYLLYYTLMLCRSTFITRTLFGDYFLNNNNKINNIQSGKKCRNWKYTVV